ncbi:hypothetical protein DL89DRAFT_264959 [Linderina pennispora]|uniref:Uncharacterized protein n=1 Tax=Linderina pennispora TaxID=61395 RepID=A0A1Y1WGU8_9FUNG|nr:uncharacterized protein DL89DRAFT_264959 [Linderina pennispora]ORX72753.1 hypothetical protein DL89DRAFT_264959 [Linderina pennispora]
MYEFAFQIVLPGYLCETMYTEHRQVSYQIKASLTTSALAATKRSAIKEIAIKRVPYYGAVWESLTNDIINVTAVWRNRIEMCALGCSRVQKDDQALRVKGVIRALEKGYRLTKVGFILEERTRTRVNGGFKCTSNIASFRYLKSSEGLDGWFGGLIIDQMAFDMELQIPKAYRKIQYDIKHGPVTVSHRLAFVVAIVDAMGHGTNLRLFTPLHIMPNDMASYDLPSYGSSFADRILLKAEECQEAYHEIEEEEQIHVDPLPQIADTLSSFDSSLYLTV